MNEIVEQLLKKRGIEDIEAFLNPSLDDLKHPESLPGIREAAEAILDAIGSHTKIAVFGDYDCDGVCATAILTKAIGQIAGYCFAGTSDFTKESPIYPFVPERLTEGYGMSEKSVARLLKEYPEVGMVITVDNGITAVEPIAGLKRAGIKVIITDHHLAGEEIPSADVIINPKVRPAENLESICGAVIAFMLANELVCLARESGKYQGANFGGPLLVMAGLATVTDIMPLLGQNRILVAEALRYFPVWAPVGLRELHLRAARTGYESLTSRDFGFMLGPRINAAGRLSTGMESLELLLAEDHDIARESARNIDGYNAERKNIELKMTEEALGKVEEGAPAQVIDLPNGHPGVAGIVAAKMLEKLGGRVPICVYAAGHGSARAPEGMNLRDAFLACADVLDKFGGHAAAGGFAVKEGKIDEFRQKFCDYCAKTENLAKGKRNADDVDAWIGLDEVTLDLAESLQKMEPFGEGNEEPIFGFRDVNFSEVKMMGSDGRHLSVVFRDSKLRGVWWNHGEVIEKLRKSSVPHIVRGWVTISEYGGRHAELKLVSIDDLI